MKTMQETQSWQGLPYFPINQFYKKHFGGKVYKIPVSTAQTCPNREGLKGMKTCNFCDVWGSAAYPEFRKKDLRDQILVSRLRVSHRTKADQFLVYFQAYTNTFAKTEQLKGQFEVATEFDFVKGFVVGTRPDCISDRVLDLWNEYAKKYFVAVELGVQSFDEGQLLWMRRGHTVKKSLWAIDKVKKSSDVDLGIHLIFGLPGETDQQVIESAKTCNSLPIDNVKLHNLHVLANTALAKEYARAEFTPLTLQAYGDRVSLFLQHLNPRIAVHRLAAVASRREDLLAPMWVKHKMQVYQYFIDHMRAKGAYQGQYFKA